MGYCKVHGDFYGRACEGCQGAEWAQSNPGDFQCPYCKYISLKYEASRCPLCHGEIETDHWIPVRAALKVAEEKSRQQVQEYERDRREREEKSKERKKNFYITGMLIAIPAIALFGYWFYSLTEGSKVCVGVIFLVVAVYVIKMIIEEL